jgi:hypothetical protein
VSGYFHGCLSNYLLVILNAFNHRLQELHVDTVVNSGIPNWMPNRSTIDDFRCSAILQRFDCTQFFGTLGFVTGHFHVAHLIEHRVDSSLPNALEHSVLGDVKRSLTFNDG